MNKTSIEWVKNPDGTQGFTWNPVTGCLKGCDYCYARKLANGRLRERYLKNVWLPELYDSQFKFDRGAQEASYDKHRKDPFYPRFWPEKLEQVSPLDKPRGIFVCNMGELFGPWLPKTWTEQVMETISEAPDHRFYLLTKQPQELIKWSPFPKNCWVGVSATNADSLFDAVNFLEDVQANVRFISLEPLLASANLVHLDVHLKGTVDWLIIGAQTKPTVLPNPEWVREIVEAADRAGVPVFLKNSIATFSYLASAGLKWRQVMPQPRAIDLGVSSPRPPYRSCWTAVAPAGWGERP